MSALGPLDLAAIRAALAAQVETAEGVRAYAVVPDAVATGMSAAVVVQAAAEWIDYHEAMKGGLTRVSWDLLIVAQSTSIEQGQRTVDELCSAGAGQSRSVFDAIMDDPTLGGVVGHCLPVGVGDVGGVEIGGVRYASAVLTVTTWIGRT